MSDSSKTPLQKKFELLSKELSLYAQGSSNKLQLVIDEIKQELEDCVLIITSEQCLEKMSGEKWSMFNTGTEEEMFCDTWESGGPKLTEEMRKYLIEGEAPEDDEFEDEE
jgi:hypothetical protein